MGMLPGPGAHVTRGSGEPGNILSGNPEVTYYCNYDITI